MKVTCLTSQEKFFETRILKRMAEPVFVPQEQLPNALQTPLVLFGNWSEGGFEEGIRWLARVAYQLPFPCLLCPPFDPGLVDQLLGLPVTLEIRAINSNLLLPYEKGLFAAAGGETFQVQADFSFVGPAGRPLVVTAADHTPVVLALQPKSTATPLLLCGVRLFSASGLSAEMDRQRLFEALVTWATAQPATAPSIESGEAKAGDLDPDLLRSLCVLLAGTGAQNAQEVIDRTNSVLGLTLTPTEVDLGLKLLAQNGLIQQEGEAIVLHPENLEQYVQQLGLWPYVRLLRRDSAKEER